jgi:hypothetical protein
MAYKFADHVIVDFGVDGQHEGVVVKVYELGGYSVYLKEYENCDDYEEARISLYEPEDEAINMTPNIYRRQAFLENNEKCRVVDDCIRSLEDCDRLPFDRIRKREAVGALISLKETYMPDHLRLKGN